MNILDRISQLATKFNSERYFNEQQIFSQWSSEATKALLIKDLSQHDGVKGIISRLEAEVEEMNLLLKNSDSKALPDNQRDRVLDKRNLYTWFLSYFSDAGKSLARIEEQVVANEKLNAKR